MTDIAQATFIDVHYHAGPDAFVRRRSVLDAGARYREAGGWVVLKNHLGCTAAQAWEARQAGLPVSASIVLNEIAGGIDRRAVERSLCQHGEGPVRLIVHFPTVTGRKHASRLARERSHPILDQRAIAPCTVSDADGRLKDSVVDILRMARDYPLVISTGHANRDEVYRLVDAAIRHDVPRLMLNQPANPLTGLRAAELRDIASAPMVYVEQTALTYLLGYQDADDFRAVLADVPRVVYSSDLGQTSQPDIADWLRTSSGWFDAFGLSRERIDDITRVQPLALLT
ncbi:hypothetical protein EGY31_20230 [Burkholderia multivorans]|uniref:DUF6282 family protein n=1 Tax=Burkholderia ubonensis TaxID=101571 RepID=UPI00075959A4|nr:DUF6282 family protein [Burkholderia ubonensis]AYZ65618.1 hypothetical protein EGY31_20230 [Burkholderia multivorans]KUZ79432.1 hypothetical protein WI36_08080 [Burkholderia ubonensis]VWC19922.1 hypothetical protein BUB20358_05779 [Burkholderia ubonensis]